MTQNSLLPGFSRYFLALVPPEPVFGQCMEFKNYFALVHNSRGALRSPPHITLHMPFSWADRKTTKLISALENLAAGLKPFEIHLNGFGCFAPRVIFIRIEPAADLNLMHKKTEYVFKTELNLFNAVYRNEAFMPHLTVAFRDLKKEAFNQAWQEFQHKPYEAVWKIENICLLKNDGEKWEPFKWFPCSELTV